MNPTVTVLVTHHLDCNRPYLDLCLQALDRTEGIEIEVIVLADSESCPTVPDGMTLVHNPDLNTATKKVHFGVAMSHPESKYFLLLSDDVVIGKRTIQTLVQTTGDQHGIMNPMSNSDNGGQFYAKFKWGCNADISEFTRFE